MVESTTRSDFVVYVLILIFVALQFAFYLRIPGFDDSEITYVELARSITERAPYGFDHRPETRFPPGFPLILAAISLVTGFTFGLMVRAMTIFTALGFMVSYEVIRREEGRLCAALICLVLLSSPMVFNFATQNLLPELPYVLSSFVVLLAARQTELAKGTSSRTVMWLCTTFALVSSLMIRTAAITLLTGLFLWLAVSFVSEKKAALARVRLFFPILLLGVLAQAVWAYRAKITEVNEWPLNGYPGSYFTEALLKRGDYPELGNATLGEILSRLGDNLIGYALGFTTMVSRKAYITPFWSSLAVALPLLLITVGMISKILRKRNRLEEWYFISYMAMFLLWPWDYRVRFLMPVAPLACLYFWCGVKELFRFGIEKPRMLGLASLPLCGILSVSSAIQVLKVGGFQPRLSCTFWLVSAVFAMFLLWKSKQNTDSFYEKPWLFRETTWTKAFRLRRWVALAVTLPIVVIGFLIEVEEGRANLKGEFRNVTDIAAAQYLDLHMPKNAVVMARRSDVVYHYSRRRVVWFPPISDPQLLMDGIRRQKVEFILVVERSRNPWLPKESECFQGLSIKYPGVFHLVHQAPHFSVFQISD